VVEESVAVAGALAARHWREADARAVLEAWRESGETITEYARNRGIHAERLARWERKLRLPAAQAVSFHPVRVTGQLGSARPAYIEVVLGQEPRVRVPSGFAPQDLRAVLAVLAESR
jgi:hypothetical protein